MIEVHHLDKSRSQRVIWLLEELEVPYRLVGYKRQAGGPAPPELKAIHPLGKAPVIKDGDIVLPESGAIVEYLIGQYGNGRFAPKPGTPDHARYLYWLHYAEGSAMSPLMLIIMGRRAGEAGGSFVEYGDAQLAQQLIYVEAELAGREFLVAGQFTGADVLVSFPLEVAAARGYASAYPNITAYLTRLHARPAYQVALAKGTAV